MSPSSASDRGTISGGATTIVAHLRWSFHVCTSIDCDDACCESRSVLLDQQWLDREDGAIALFIVKPCSRVAFMFA